MLPCSTVFVIITDRIYYCYSIFILFSSILSVLLHNKDSYHVKMRGILENKEQAMVVKGCMLQRKMMGTFGFTHLLICSTLDTKAKKGSVLMTKCEEITRAETKNTLILYF